MSLNLNDPEDSSDLETQGAGPILHEPGLSEPKFSKKIILIAAGAILVLAGLFVIWKLGVFSSPGSVAPSTSESAMKSEPAKPADEKTSSPIPERQTSLTQQPVDNTPSKISEAERSVTPQRPATSSSATAGKYTIYISRQKSRSPAEEESSRWKQAGYESYVTEEEGWFKVSIGRYATWEDANGSALGLKDAFEAGYHIGKIVE